MLLLNKEFDNDIDSCDASLLEAWIADDYYA